MNKEPTTPIVCNRIRTPDGTILESRTVHDYRTYKDSNGHTYMVDGGTAYLRRTVIKESPYTELSVYSDDPHEEVREVLTWGTYGPKGDQPLKYKLLKDLSVDHINNILRDCTHIPNWYRELLKTELVYREDNETV